MTVAAKFFSSGIEYIDIINLMVNKTVSQNTAVSNFNVTLDSPYGRHKSDFNINDEVTVYTSGTDIGYNKLFTGTIELVDFQGQGLHETVNLQGNDYSSRLIDNTIPPTVYTNTEIGSIVRDIIKNNTTEIGSNFIQNTSTVLKRISFNEVPIYDAIQDLADLSGYTFYIDNNKQFHFELAGSSPTGYTLGSDSIIKTIFDKTKEGMANRVAVYGDRYLVSPPQEAFTITNQGSVFTLGYKPHNTSVSTSLTAGSLLRGGIFEVNSSVYSGTDYLVNFDDKHIILISGNNAIINYNNIPPNGGSVVVNYDRSLPIIKIGQDDTSIAAYGKKTKIINDKSIKDPNTAAAIRDVEIQKSSPLNNLQLDLRGWFAFEPGRTVNISLADFNLVDSGIPIVQVHYNFDKQRIHENKIISVILDKRPVDITDKLRDINRRLEAIEAQDRTETDILSRLQYATGSGIFIGSSWYVSTKNINDSFIDKHPYNGILGEVGSHLYAGSMNGTKLRWITGTIGAGFDRALGFPGSGTDNSFISMQNSLSGLITGSGNFTVSFWAQSVGSYTSNSTSIQSGNNFVFNMAGQSLYPRIHLTPEGSLSMQLRVNNISKIGGLVQFPINQWNHVLTQYDPINGSIITYVNNNLKSTTNVGPGSLTMGQSGKMFIGRDNNITSYISGAMDDLRVYNRLLNVGEIGSLFNKQNVNGSLILHLKFDEGQTITGSYVYNSASGGNSVIQPFLGDRRSVGSILRSGGFY